MIIRKSINHLKLFNPYSFISNTFSTINKKRSFVIANDINYEYCYKKTEIE